MCSTTIELNQDLVATSYFSKLKQVLRMTETVPEHEAFKIHDACSAVEAVNRSEDLKEGAKAFSEKREPIWGGK